MQDGKIIWLRHGSYVCKVSINRLIPVSDELSRGYRAAEESPLQKDDSKQVDDPKENHVAKKVNNITFQSDSESNHSDVDIDPNDQNDSDQEGNHNLDVDDDQDNHSSENDQSNHSAQEDNESNHESSDDNDQDETSEDDNDSDDDANDQQINDQELPNQAVDSPIIIKKYERVEVKDEEQTEGKWERATITGRAGKAKTWPNHWNFQCDNGKKFYADVKELELRKMPEEEALAVYTHEDILAVMIPKDQQNTEECLKAKENELAKLKDFNTYEVVDDIGQDHITCTWVMTRKGDEARARLTARGFQEEADIPSDSPTLQKANLRTILAIAATKDWEITATDIKSAFLQGSNLEREVFVKPPKEADMKGKLWRLIKCLYGLKDASRAWYNKVESKLEKAGFEKSYHDAGLFFLKRNGKLLGIVGIHVDDFISTGTLEFSRDIIPKVLSVFQVGKSENESFLYTGFKIKKNKNNITLDQQDYISRIEMPILDATRLLEKEDDLTPKELTIYRMMVGCTNWVARITRPDLNYDMVSLSTKFKGGKVEDLKTAKKVLANIVQNEATITLSSVGDLRKAELWLYTDASFGNLNNGVDSTGSYILLLINPKNGKCAPLDWKANKIKRVVNSTLAAEALSLYAGLDAAIAMKNQLRMILGKDYIFPLRAIVDNKSTVDTVHAAVSLTTEKRLRKEIGSIKEMMKKGKLQQLKWVPTELMLADALTKKGVNSLKLLKVMQTGCLGDDYLNSVR